MTTAIATNIRQIPRIPGSGDFYLSIDLGKVEINCAYRAAERIGVTPQLVSIQYPQQIQIHLLICEEHYEPGTVLESEHVSDGYLQAIEDLIPDDAIRLVYGGKRKVSEQIAA